MIYIIDTNNNTYKELNDFMKYLYKLGYPVFLKPIDNKNYIVLYSTTKDMETFMFVPKCVSINAEMSAGEKEYMFDSFDDFKKCMFRKKLKL